LNPARQDATFFENPRNASRRLIAIKEHQIAIWEATSMDKPRYGAHVVAIVAALSAFTFDAGHPGQAQGNNREVYISGFGARSGVLRSFGINSEAALRAAAQEINSKGGVRLGDGGSGKIVIDYLDTRCNAEEAISVARRIASSPSIVAIGPTCSGEAEPLLGVLQKKVGDTRDTGLRLPVFGDTAVKAGLA
jgi:branched-chain amino acid transport system substrate-binding protein